MIPIQFVSEWVVRSCILILAGALLVWLLRVKSPAVRLMAWTVMLAGSLAIPLLTAVLPAVPIAVRLKPVQPFASVTTTSSGMPSATRASVPAPAPAASVSASLFDWRRFAVVLYALAAAVLFLRLIVGVVLSLRVFRRSRSTGLAVEGTEVRESGHVESPVAIGIFRPAILLPLDWRDWDSEKLNAVLAHECSHIRRFDPAVQFFSAIHRALLWASPLSWLLHRSIVRTAEEVSDDEAMLTVSDRVSYAEILLQLMQRGVGQTNWHGVPMARYDLPEKRIRRILDSTTVSRRVTRWSAATILALGIPLAYVTAAAQTGPRSASGRALPEFEVDSIKLTDHSDSTQSMGAHVYPGGRVTVIALPLKALIRVAFRTTYEKVAGGEAWTEDDEYNVQAKAPEAMRADIKDLRYTLFGIEDEHLREMLQALLIRRFQLKFHRETKTGEVYLLQRTGKPLPLRSVVPAADADPAADSTLFGSIGYVGGKWSIFATSMPQLADFASSFILHAPVLDRTGVSGRFDYRERMADADPKYGGDQSDSFRNYLLELGLKLEHTKGPVETFVIDHAEKPSLN